MLARHAENLFWAGRYIERAEDTARLLDVTYHTLVESPLDSPRDAWGSVLEVLYLDEDFGRRGLEVNEENVTRYLVFDPTNDGSVLAAVGRTRENLRNVRDGIPTELWEAVNTFHLELAALDLPGELDQNPYRLYKLIKNRCQLIAGVTLETMPRDDGYAFSLLGRLLERAEMTCRMLKARYGRLDRDRLPVSFQHWMSLLKSASGFEAYLRRYRAEIQAEKVLEFLLMAPDFPRSVLHCLQAAEGRIRILSPGDGQTPPERMIGRVRAHLEYREVGEVLSDGIDPFLAELQDGIRRVADAIEEQFFRGAAQLELHTYGLA